MAFIASALKKIKIKDLPKIKVDVYSMIALNNLVVYAVHYLQEHEVTATVEEIVSICFRLFPQSFALKNYPHWPDSALVIRRLNDAREKEHLKGNSMDGFALKYKGKQLVKKISKMLGLARPATIRKKTISAETGIILDQAPKVTEKQKKVISQPKNVVAPVVSRKANKKQSSRPSPLPIKLKQEVLPLIKAEEKPNKKFRKFSTTPLIKKEPVKKEPQRLGSTKIKTAQSGQLVMPLLTSQGEKVKPLQVLKKKEGAQLTPSVIQNVSKEEKAKAGKFVHLIERSDAYIQYKKNGKNSKIGEFDFRSLLLCTMESSHETLIKNIKLFKGYAGIHNRQDLLIFLNDCEDQFSSLLTQPQKQSKRKLVKK